MTDKVYGLRWCLRALLNLSILLTFSSNINVSGYSTTHLSLYSRIGYNRLFCQRPAIGLRLEGCVLVDGIHLLSHESSRGGFAVPAPNNRGLRLYPRSNEVILNPIQLFLKSNNKSLEDDDLVESSLQSPASHDCTVETPSSGRKGLFSGVRSYMRAATGFSITSLRATMRAATGVSITKLVKKFTGMIPIGVRSAFPKVNNVYKNSSITRMLGSLLVLFQLRFIFQPFLILYFWPLFLFRCLLGLSKDSKIEARQNHNRFVTAWKDALKAAQEANESDKWPFNVICK